jgi:hypothetical protein
VDETNERGFKYPPVFAYLLQPFALLSGLAALAVCVAVTGRPRRAGLSPLQYSL